MDMQMIYSLFRLFSGEEDAQKYMPVLTTAIQEVKSSLRSQEDEQEVRLCYLAAAVANLRYTQIFGAQQKALATYAGTAAKESDFSHQIRFAEQLVNSYKSLCHDLIQEENFFFADQGLVYGLTPLPDGSVTVSETPVDCNAYDGSYNC